MDTIQAIGGELAGIRSEVERVSAYCATTRIAQRGLNQHAAITDVRLDAIESAVSDIDTRLGFINEAVNHLLDRLPASA